MSELRLGWRRKCREAQLWPLRVNTLLSKPFSSEEGASAEGPWSGKSPGTPDSAFPCSLYPHDLPFGLVEGAPMSLEKNKSRVSNKTPKFMEGPDVGPITLTTLGGLPLL